MVQLFKKGGNILLQKIYEKLPYIIHFCKKLSNKQNETKNHLKISFLWQKGANG